MLLIAALTAVLLAVLGVYIGGCLAMRERICGKGSLCPLVSTGSSDVETLHNQT